ncbi:hypothetical protein [uncultured Tateyamaria sp.]|uniref:hypothetical protein n=1 Tax=uncultured Tateyamaria sp. TaxID=455651 RepID=UPI002620F76E|nr:hypothetical protein [uncultured Tateyamaria sp.]
MSDFKQHICSMIGLAFLCSTLPANADDATTGANRIVTHPKLIQKQIPHSTRNQFTSGVRPAKPSSHLGPNFRLADPSSHLGPNFRTTGHGADSRKR